MLMWTNEWCRVVVQLSLMPEQTVLPLVDRSSGQEITAGVTFQHPDIIANADVIQQHLSEPYYWKLPKQFRGSMVRSTSSVHLILFKVHMFIQSWRCLNILDVFVILSDNSLRWDVKVRHLLWGAWWDGPRLLWTTGHHQGRSQQGPGHGSQHAAVSDRSADPSWDWHHRGEPIRW